jgi:hypothetical protein
MDLRLLVLAPKASIEAPVMIRQQRKHGGLVPLKAPHAIYREMDDQDLDHGKIPFSRQRPPGSLPEGSKRSSDVVVTPSGVEE